jgi:drug/metabolite transporter (DMT)-like permease
VVVGAALSSVLAKLALTDVPAFTFVWLQIAIGGGLLALYTFGWRRERLPRGLGAGTWALVAAIGILNFAVVRVAFMLALARVPATTHAYLVNFVGIVTMFMSVVVLGERPFVVQVVGAGLAISGLRVFFPEIPPPTQRTGVLLLAIGILALAATNTLARKLGRAAHNGLSNHLLATLALAVGGLPVVLTGLTIDGLPRVAGLRDWSIITLNGIVSIAVGPTVWFHVLRTLRSYEASLLATTAVIWTALLALPILGERLALHQIAGIGMMLVGVGLAQVHR